MDGNAPDGFGLGAGVGDPAIYTSPAYLEREARHLWPRAWQVACHEGEVREPGDYVSYEIGRDSIVVLRDQSGTLRAFHNACRHRGRRLVEGCGAASRLVCPFHSWKYNLDGSIQEVLDRPQWNGALSDAELALVPVKVDVWGGWVWINMDPGAEPLAQFLGAARAHLDPFEFEN